MRISLGILPLLVAASSAGGPHRYEKVVNRDVVVIGGGSSGTYAALRLLDEDVSVVVVEKEDHLGGHTNTYIDPDTHQPFNLGVAVFHKSPIVSSYFEKLGVALQNASTSDTSSASPVYVDFDTGRRFDYVPPSAQALGATFEKYGKLVGEKYPYLSLGYDLPDPVPQELLAPYSEFVKKYGLEDIVQFVNVINGNIGDILKRPTLYGIKAFSALLVQAVADGFVNAASGDNWDLYRAAQKVLEKKNNVIYRSTVTKITRSKYGVLVSVNTPGQEIIITAKKLIVAIPPLKKTLQQVNLDLTAKEAHLFEKFKGFLYGSSVLTHRGVNGSTTFNNVGTTTPYHLMRLPGCIGFTPLVGKVPTNKFSAYFSSLNSSETTREIKKLIKTQLGNLEDEGTIGHGEASFKFFTNHAPYHLHVSKEDVKNGFYKQLYALEGEENTFWTGATFADNDSSTIWTWTESYLLPLILASLKGKAN